MDAMFLLMKCFPLMNLSYIIPDMNIAHCFYVVYVCIIVGKGIAGTIKNTAINMHIMNIM